MWLPLCEMVVQGGKWKSFPEISSLANPRPGGGGRLQIFLHVKFLEAKTLCLLIPTPAPK